MSLLSSSYDYNERGDADVVRGVDVRKYDGDSRERRADKALRRHADDGRRYDSDYSSRCTSRTSHSRRRRRQRHPRRHDGSSRRSAASSRQRDSWVGVAVVTVSTLRLVRPVAVLVSLFCGYCPRFVCPVVCPSIRLSIRLSVRLSVAVSVALCLSVVHWVTFPLA